MKKFNIAYNVIIEDIIQSVTPEELKERRKEYGKMRLKLYFDKLIENNKMVKNEDGTYDANADINLRHMNLTSLEDLPYKLNKIDGDFFCANNKLTNLKGFPKTPYKDIMCSNNLLTTLEGCPEIIYGDFYCSGNQLTSLEGCPKKIYGDFYCSGNMQNEFTEENIRKICKVIGGVYVFQ